MRSSKESTVLQEVRGEVGIVTLNRPQVRNALNMQLRLEMRAALDAMDDDPSVLAVVLTGAGGTFCAGRDLKAAREGEPMYPNRSTALRSFNRTSIGKPVIAAIEGYALAGGFELALSCDLLVASNDARFGLPEVKRNLVAIGGALVRLPQRIPYHRAMEFALLGEQIPAEEMHRLGVVNRLAAPGEALDEAVRFGEALSANGPSAVKATKAIIRRYNEWLTEAGAFDAQQAMAEPAFNSTDSQEGIAAFLQKRSPVWTDR